MSPPNPSIDIIPETRKHHLAGFTLSARTPETKPMKYPRLVQRSMNNCMPSEAKLDFSPNLIVKLMADPPIKIIKMEYGSEIHFQMSSFL